jgi:phosphatidylglycerophosphate synthase
MNADGMKQYCCSHRWTKYVCCRYAAGSLWDGLDWLTARLLKQKTEFGKRLDPLVDATAFVTGLSALAVASPELHERMLLISALVTQTLYSSHLSHKWKNITNGKKKDLWPSIIGKTKTAIMMVSITKLMWWPHFLQDIQQFLESHGISFLEWNLEQLDTTLHLASISWVGIGILWTLWSWYSYNKKVNTLLGWNN